MSTRWLRALTGIGAVAALTVAVTLHAAPQDSTAGQGRPRSRQDGARPGLGRRGLLGGAANRLGLTDAQTQQIRSLAKAHRGEWTALAERLTAARTSLREATTAAQIDESAIRQRAADVAAVQADIAVARARVRAEIFQVLTPDQQAQVQALQKRRSDRQDTRRKRRARLEPAGATR